MMTVRGRRLVLLFLAVVLTLGVVSCTSTDPAVDHPAAIAVDELLELRRDDVRDPREYVPYFLESSLATALAEGSDEPTGTPRVPRWEPPYVSEETSTTASVVVVWKVDDDFEGWPAINIFLMSLEGERWVVTDAVEATSAPTPIGKRDEQ